MSVFGPQSGTEILLRGRRTLPSSAMAGWKACPTKSGFRDRANPMRAKG